MSFIIHGPTIENPLYLPSMLGVPHQRKDCLIHRAHLIKKLNENVQFRMMCVTAPAGLGKTTLLAEWAEQCQYPVAWVSLVKEDNTNLHFWMHVIGALQTIQPHLGEDALMALSLSEGLAEESFLLSLLKDIYTIQEDFVLILDDYHLAGTNGVHKAMADLVEHLPRHMHLVLSSREMPALSLARLRVNGQLFELTADDLQFSRDEIAEFFAHLDSVNLSDDDIHLLLAKTGGWVALLQLVGLAMRQKQQVDVSAYIVRLSGSDHLLAEYLIEEVLAQQPEEVRNFLLKTSVLDPLCGALCDAILCDDDCPSSLCDEVLGMDDCSSAQVLERLECSGIPIVAIDAEHTWFRYHQLFLEMLRSRLRKTEQPEQVKELHRRASQWYQSQGLLVEAMETALAGSDYLRTAQLLEENYGSMALRCDLHDFLRWIESIPGELLQSRPRLCIARARALLPFERMEEIEGCLRLAESIIENLPDIRYDAAEYQSLLGEVMGMRVMKATQLLDNTRIKPLALMALDLLPAGRVDLRGVIHVCLGISYILTGELAEARRILAEVIEMQFAVDDISIANSLVYLAHYFLAVIANNEGHLSEAAGQLHLALRISTTKAGVESHVAGISHIALSSILYEKNEIDEAIFHARLGLDMCKSWWVKGSVRQAHLVLAHALQAKGDHEGALSSAQKIFEVDNDDNEIIQSPHISIPYLQAWIRDKGLALLNRLIGEIDILLQGVDEASNATHWWKTQIAVQILLATGRLEQAEKHLSSLLKKLETHGYGRCLIECLVMQVYLYHAKGDTRRALTVLLHALSLAENEEYIRVFIDIGPFIKPLLEKAGRSGIDFAYIETILDAFNEQAFDAEIMFQMLLEPLSRRELEVLRLLASGLSTREIAGQLFIAVDTVRKHTKNILAKLQVHTRLQAVQQARQLDIL